MILFYDVIMSKIHRWPVASMVVIIVNVFKYRIKNMKRYLDKNVFEVFHMFISNLAYMHCHEN